MSDPWDRVEIVEALRWLAHLLAPIDMPKLTSQSWRQGCRGATVARCGGCELCERDAQIERDHAAHPERMSTRQTDRRWRWRSLSAAMTWYVRTRADPPAIRSATGASLERAALGMMSKHVAVNAADAGRATDWIDDLADIDRSLDRVGEPPAKEVLMFTAGGMLPHATGIADINALAAALCMSTSNVRALARSSRRRMTVDMVARGMMRPPEGMSVRMAAAVDARRKELTT